MVRPWMDVAGVWFNHVFGSEFAVAVTSLLWFRPNLNLNRYYVWIEFILGQCYGGDSTSLQVWLSRR